MFRVPSTSCSFGILVVNIPCLLSTGLNSFESERAVGKVRSHPVFIYMIIMVDCNFCCRCSLSCRAKTCSYETVEREAPSLLDFIPRYLGVMLVNYRGAPKSTESSNAPHSERNSHRARPSRRRTDPFTRQNHFILMEDLTGKLKHSCVLDLKMETRQYGMDATVGKKKSRRKMCDKTTCRKLGVR